MDVRLYQAALRGNVSLLTQLLQEDSQLLVRALDDCSGKNDPLHMAARLGHFDFIKEILTHKPQFAGKLNSRGQAPLHLASAKGHVEVVKELLRVYPEACYFHDKDGTTPFHIAAMKGRVHVLEELVVANKETAWLLTNQGDPVLHLCVHHDQYDALKMLVEKVDGDEFVNLKDDHDNTILHLLVAKNQYEVIEFLLTDKSGVDVNVVNVDGSTALDVSRENSSGSELNRLKIREILKKFGAKKARKISPTWPKERAQKMSTEKNQNWLNTMKESLMVVATLMASMAFQAALSPPGGVWQEDGYHNITLNYDPNDNPGQLPHRAGEAVISYTLPHRYKAITLSTALGLLASLSLILLLVSGFSFQRKISIWILIITTWMAVASIMVTYLFSYFALTSIEVFGSRDFWKAVPGVICVWGLLICIIFSVHMYRVVRRLGVDFSFQYVGKFFCKFRRLLHECGTHFERLKTTVAESRVETNP